MFVAPPVEVYERGHLEEESDALDFISKVHRKQPDLLVFQLSVWRSDLAETLKLLETIEKGTDTPHQ